MKVIFLTRGVESNLSSEVAKCDKLLNANPPVTDRPSVSCQIRVKRSERKQSKHVNEFIRMAGSEKVTLNSSFESR